MATTIADDPESVDVNLIELSYGDHTITSAAQEELVRMKGLAILSRNLTRDYLDFAALDLGLRDVRSSAANALARSDDYYAESTSTGSVAREIITALADPHPREHDPQAVLDELIAVREDLRNWDDIRGMCQRIVGQIE